MDDMPAEREDRLRERAYRIWVEEGRPDGQAERHWELASELLTIEESPIPTLEPSAAGKGPFGEPVEPSISLENQGEFPILADQGDKQAMVSDSELKRPVLKDKKSAQAAKQIKKTKR